jgi:hypothetical protein
MKAARLGHPPVVPAQSDTLAFGRSNSFSIARSGDLLIAQLLASAAPSAEHKVRFRITKGISIMIVWIVSGVHLPL